MTLQLQAQEAGRHGRLLAWATETATTLAVRCAYCEQAVPTVRVAHWLYAFYGAMPAEPTCSDAHWHQLIDARD